MFWGSLLPDLGKEWTERSIDMLKQSKLRQIIDSLYCSDVQAAARERGKVINDVDFSMRYCKDLINFGERETKRQFLSVKRTSFDQPFAMTNARD
jgi:hypothetical protein